jgi:hypothetical protein
VKRRDLVKRIAREAKRQRVEWTIIREGGNHSVYRLDTAMIPIPRHTELGERLAEDIFKECEGVLGKGWWRR